ncbi:MAG TPA: DNA-directed RNA polymerase subunit alpha C-terminal domain-containing protein [Anaerolineaceae bacterium]|nr:DNA-directed RNA polymerase subunit alpha C-terminal domain-containing protein [Anaerolineaceae bacterium]
MQARQEYIEDKEQKAAEKVSPTRPIAELEVGKRATDALGEAGIKTVGDLLTKLEAGETPILEIPGVGRKTLIDIKKKLRQFGYTIPEAAEEIKV